MRTRILSSQIDPPHFFMPDGGGAGGGVAAPPAPAEGGGEGSGGGAPDNTDIIDLAAPDPGEISDAIFGKGEPPAPGVKAKPDAGKPDAKKPDAKAPAAKPAPAKPAPAAKPPPEGEPPVEQLRAQYETQKAELEALKERYAPGHPDVIAAQKERDDTKKQLEAANTRAKEFEQKLLVADPRVTAELRKVDDEYNEKAGKFYGRVPEMDMHTVNALVREFAKLPFGTPEYRAAYQEFEKVVNERLGAREEGQTARNLDKTMDWIAETYDFAKKRPGIEKAAFDNARKLVFEGDKKEFGARKTRVTDLLAKAKQIPEGMSETDIMHPVVALANFDKGLEPKQLETLDANIEKYIELAVAGIPPRGAEDYVGLTDEQVAESQAREGERVQAARDHIVTALYHGMRAVRRFPYLLRELQKYREKAGENIDDNPPNPDGQGGGGGEGGGEDDDLTTLTKPEIPRF